MISTEQLNKIWARALRDHAVAPLQGEDGPYRAIGDRTLAFLDGVWKARRPPVPDVGAMIAAGKTVRFWSDPHFGHDNIIRLASRTAFRDVDHMDRSIWANVEAAAAGSDLLVCLGDLSLKNPLTCQRRLVSAFGARQLTVVGNHDAKGGKPEAWAAAGACASLAFSLPLELLREWAMADNGEMAGLIDWKRAPDPVNFGCSHWPVPAGRAPGASWVNVHGHIHNASRDSRKLGPLSVNCSVEAIGYEPKTLRELMTLELLDNLVRRQRGSSLSRASNARSQKD
jgi:calcineurin-like phosphoesterase family protein